MPAIRGTYYNHPQTGEVGIWVWTAFGSNSIIGLTQTQLLALRPSGTVSTRLARFGEAIRAKLQPMLEVRMLTTSVNPEQVTSPDPFCRVEGSEFVAQVCVVEIIPISLDPVNFQITIKDGVSRSEYV